MGKKIFGTIILSFCLLFPTNLAAKTKDALTIHSTVVDRRGRVTHITTTITYDELTNAAIGVGSRVIIKLVNEGARKYVEFVSKWTP